MASLESRLHSFFKLASILIYNMKYLRVILFVCIGLSFNKGSAQSINLPKFEGKEVVLKMIEFISPQSSATILVTDGIGQPYFNNIDPSEIYSSVLVKHITQLREQGFKITTSNVYSTTALNKVFETHYYIFQKE